jgi:S1-C subfamily serine protease
VVDSQFDLSIPSSAGFVAPPSAGLFDRTAAQAEYTRIAEEHDLPIDYGAYVLRSPSNPAVVPDSPAEDAGLLEHDIITAIDGRRIDASNNLDDILSQYQPGDRLTLMILRNGTTRQLHLTLGVRPADLPR